MLWFWLDDPQLSTTAKDTIGNPDNQILVSPASFWELAIKISLGKYRLPTSYERFMEEQMTENGFDILPIHVRHTTGLIAMPFHHRDPFDRLIVAQAQVERIPVVSADSILDDYGIERLW